MRFSLVMSRLVAENGPLAFFLDSIPADAQDKYDWRSLLWTLTHKYVEKNSSHFLCVKFSRYKKTAQLSLLYDKDQVLYNRSTLQRNLNLYRYQTNGYHVDGDDFMIITHQSPDFNSGNPSFVFNVPRAPVCRKSRSGSYGFAAPMDISDDDVVFLSRKTPGQKPAVTKAGIRKAKTRIPIRLKLCSVTILFEEK